jgi:hypothetical protein
MVVVCARNYTNPKNFHFIAEQVGFLNSFVGINLFLASGYSKMDKAAFPNGIFKEMLQRSSNLHRK